jgi:hypothetical protein
MASVLMERELFDAETDFKDGEISVGKVDPDIAFLGTIGGHLRFRYAS